MARENLPDTIKYIEEHSFDGMVYDSPDILTIQGKQFAFARVSSYAECRSYEALVKYIEEKGGIVKPYAVKSADYLIITPSPIGESYFIYKEEQEKYSKAIEYRSKSAKPRIIRDIDFYIITGMFPKLDKDDKRRLAMECINGNPNFTDSTRKIVVDYILKNMFDDAYFRSRNISEKLSTSGICDMFTEDRFILPDKIARMSFGLQQWRRFFSISEGMAQGRNGLCLKKCRARNESIEVPAVIENKPVLKVDEKAFSNLSSSVKEVILPHTMTLLEPGAFYNCPSLQRVIIYAHKHQCHIASGAFFECPVLSEIILDGVNIAGEEMPFRETHYRSIRL